MKRCSVVLRTTILGLVIVCASGQFFPPPSAFYPFPTWVAYPFQRPPPSNFSSFNNTRYYPFYNYTQYNNSVQYGGNLFVGYIWPIDRLLFNQVIMDRKVCLPGLMNSCITWALEIFDLHIINTLFCSRSSNNRAGGRPERKSSSIPVTYRRESFEMKPSPPSVSTTTIWTETLAIPASSAVVLATISSRYVCTRGESDEDSIF